MFGYLFELITNIRLFKNSFEFINHKVQALKNDIVRTSDGGNGNQSVSLPIILIKIKVDQMLLSSYISPLMVSFL